MREIFVFGSNTEGRHGKGMALEAKLKHGAIQGQPRGLQGNSYAIVTKDLTKPKHLRSRSIPLNTIKEEIQTFLYCAHNHEDCKFIVTPIGCGLAGYTPEEIAPMFKMASGNVILPQVFKDVLNK